MAVTHPAVIRAAIVITLAAPQSPSGASTWRRFALLVFRNVQVTGHFGHLITAPQTLRPDLTKHQPLLVNGSFREGRVIALEPHTSHVLAPTQQPRGLNQQQLGTLVLRGAHHRRRAPAGSHLALIVG